MASERTKELSETRPPYIYAPTRYIPVPRYGDLSSCVKFARAYSGREIYGNASELVPTHTTNPVVGDWVLFRNHTAVIVDIQDNSISIIEANWIPDSITRRTIQLDDKSIRGYL